jgi:hypothetical protein
MNKRALGLATLAALLVAAPAPAQSLGKALAELRQQREKERSKASRNIKTEILQALLYKKITVEFDETPAREAFEFIKDTLGVNIVVRYSDDTVGYGIEAEAPITFAAKEMRALDVLELMLDQVALVEETSWQLRSSFLEIGTKERLAAPAARVVRMYPIDDLLYEVPKFTNAPSVGFATHVNGFLGGYGYGGGYGGFGGGFYGAGSGGYGGSIQPIATGPTSDELRREKANEIIEMIVDAIDPTAWTLNGGDWADIKYRDGVLVVRAPDFIHRQVGGYGVVPPPKQRDRKKD